MRISQGELLQTGMKALEGLGLPHGLDRDAILNVLWLETRGLGGMALLAEEITTGRAASRWMAPEIVDDGDMVRIRWSCTSSGASGLLLAPGAVDHLSLHRRVFVPDCHAALLFVAEASRRLSHPCQAMVDLATKSGDGRAWCGGEALFSPGFDRLAGQASVTIQPVKQPSAPPAGRSTVLDSTTLARGIAVDPALWKIIRDAAKHVLVPASALSRGSAGAEVDDSA